MSIGVDIVKIERIVSLMRHPQFFEKVFTPRERAFLAERKDNPASVAGLFALKEAITKVLGRGIGPIGFHTMEIVHDAAGKPSVVLREEAEEALRACGLKQIQLSVSHEKEYATAMAVGVPTGIGVHRTEALSIHPELALSLLRRDKRGYKTQYGRVGLVGGSTGMAGSVCMSAQAALRTGAGMVHVAVPEGIGLITQIKLTEAIVHPIADGGRGCFHIQTVPDVLKVLQGCDVVAIGPGLGRDSDSPVWLRAVMEAVDIPVVLDADGLYALAQDRSILEMCRGRGVITPHEAEMSRLTGYTLAQIRRDRARIATEFADRYGIIVVLKGADTVITDGSVYFLNNTGNPGMATAGSGDVLTGMMAALLAYGYPQRLAVRLACYLHGIAGDFARDDKGEDGMIATDIIEAIPYALKALKELGDYEYD